MTTADTGSINNDTMRIIESPASNDVLCGKDKTYNRNIGNMIYRQLIISTAPRYARIKTKPEKMKITANIVHTMIHQHNSRFLKQILVRDDGNDDENSTEYYWQEISITAARDKTSHALRFCASQMRLHNHHEQHIPTTTTINNNGTAPVTPTTERRSVRGRPQRKSIRYSPSHVEAATSITTTSKRNPIRHRRTVSGENVALPHPPAVVTSSIDPNEYYSQHSYYHYNQQYHYPYHESNHYVHYRTEEPMPLECSSSSVPTYIDPHQSTEGREPYIAAHHNTPYYGNDFGKYYHRSPAVPHTGVERGTDEYEDEEDDDLDAILREPIQWDDDNVEENDDDGEKKDGDAFEL